MKKLTKENISYFKSMLYDLIYKELNLISDYKYKIDIKINYKKEYECNIITINVSNMYKKDSVCSQFYHITFLDNYLSKFETTTLFNDGYMQINYLDNRTLSFISVIYDNVVEFYKNL